MPIAEQITDHGYYWRYDHPLDEPEETFYWVCSIAEIVAGTEARKSGRSYYVAAIQAPISIFVLRFDNPELTTTAMTVMTEITPEGNVLRRSPPTRH